ncbi:S8 family serine peptidase [Pseudohongiella acticola]|uniref:S8 family serine peptidase n=1 Tax=Pseudohongiella acticola TaxID=1524254 RepID=UPI0030EE2848
MATKAQLVPDAVQDVVDRQTEQAQQQAADRALEQARERVQQQAEDRVQTQTTEQVLERTAERAQEQATDRAQQQAAERTQQQTAERTQEQAIDRVQSQTIDRVQGQAQAAQDQLQEQVQDQVLDRVQGGQTSRVQEQLLERTAQQLERTSQQLERAGQQLERTQQELESVTGRASDVATGRLLPAVTQSGAEIAQQATQLVRERIPGPSPMASLPDRLPIIGADGSEMFVEVAIAPDIRALEREWVMMLSEAQRDQLIDEAPELMRYLTQTSDLDALDSVVLRFRVPPDLDTNDQLLALVPETMRELIDRNHVYSAQSAQPVHPGQPGQSVQPPDNTHADDGADDNADRLSTPMRAVCEDPVSVGVIDSMINTDHAAFSRPSGAASVFVSRQFLQDKVDMSSGHGTAVAGVLVGDGRAHGGDLAPLLPGATIYNASVVYSQDVYHQGATVVHLLEAINWMLGQEQVRVINMSLAGPANRLLEQVIMAAQAQNRIVVAAAGNAGPHAALLYPAAYSGVVTGTAVADDRSAYRWAAQGDHVDFAALGVSVPTARGDGSFGRESGTSMAAPVVSAFFACELASGSSPEQARRRLMATAMDLGTTGHDPVFGHGLLHP